MSERVVDRFEVVEIEQHEIDDAAVGEHAVGLVEKESPVVETCQFIARRQSVELAHGIVEAALTPDQSSRRAQLRDDRDFAVRFRHEVVVAEAKRADLGMNVFARRDHHRMNIGVAIFGANLRDQVESVDARHLVIDDQ